jgi:sec-independent protein translocase protein TatB
MFDIAWSELLVIAVIALVVIGPRDLPAALRTFGRLVSKARRMASDFQGQFNEAMKEAELDGLRKELAELKRTTHGMLDAPNPSALARDELRKSLTGTTPSSVAKSAAASASAGAAAAAEPDAPPPADETVSAPRPADLPVPPRADAPTAFDGEAKP